MGGLCGLVESKHDLVPDSTFDPEAGKFTSRLAPRYFNYRKASIYAGSNEIQRNIIAKMTLGL